MEGLASIPTPPHQLRPWAVEFYINGTGGSMMSVGQGTGGVEPHPTPTAEKVDKLVKLCNLSLNNLYTNLLLMCYES